MLKTPMKVIAAGLVGGSVLLTAACGSVSRPSEADILKAISNPSNVAQIPTSQLTKTQLSCIAQAIEDSKLSNNALKALVDGKSTFRASSGDDAAMTDVETKLTACVK